MLTGPTLLAEIERFLRSGVCSESYFGFLCVGDSKLVARLRAGGTVTLEKAERIIAFIKKAEATGWGCLGIERNRTPDWVREWRKPREVAE